MKANRTLTKRNKIKTKSRSTSKAKKSKPDSYKLKVVAAKLNVDEC